MEYKSVIDLAALADALNVPDGFMEAGGHKVPMRQWTAKDLPAAAELAKKALLPGEPLAIVGVAPSWVLGAITAAVYPKPVVFYVPAVELAFDVVSLPQGAFAPEGEMSFEVAEKDGDVYIDWQSDNPSKPFEHGPHNYDYSKISLVRIPPVSPKKRVFLSGRGAFPVALSIASGYLASGSSVWMRYQNEDHYTCVSGAETGAIMPVPVSD